MTRAILSSVCLLVAAASLFAADAASAPLWAGENVSVRMVSLGVLPGDAIPGTLSASPVGERIAYAVRRDGGEFIRIDSSRERTYDQVLGPSREGVIWGPDGRWITYQARTGKDFFLVVAGVATPVEGIIEPGSIVVSRDGARWACVAKVGERERVVAGAQEGRPYERIIYGPVLSWDGRRCVYVGRRGGLEYVNIDGVELKGYDEVRPPIYFCAGDTVIFAARSGAKWLLNVGAHEGQEFDCVSDPVISPDMRHVSYATMRNGKARVVCDQWPGAPYDVAACMGKPVMGDPLYLRPGGDQSRFVGVRNPSSSIWPATDNAGVVWSCDSLHFAYVASDKGKWFVVVDGIKGAIKYDHMCCAAPFYSPDGRLLYAARRDRKAFIVVAGKEISSHDDVDWDSLALSPGGDHWACFVRDGREWSVERDGVDAGAYSDILPGTLTFSPDGDRLAGIVSPGMKWFNRRWAVVVDGVTETPYNRVQGASLRFGPGSRHLSYVATRGHDYVVVVDGVAGGPCRRIAGQPVWSDNGEHLAYAASAGGNGMIVVDGVKGPSYDEIVPGSRIVFDSNDSVHVLVRRGAEILRLEAKITRQ